MAANTQQYKVVDPRRSKRLKTAHKAADPTETSDISQLPNFSMASPGSNAKPENQQHKPLDETTQAGQVLKKLGLIKYYPSKISLQDVMAIGHRSVDDESNFAWRMLERLIMLDYMGREVMRDEADSTMTGEMDKEKSFDDFGIDEFMADIAGSSNVQEKLNPIDIFTAVYACCDLLLKQILAQKMFLCRLAVPLLSPNFFVKDSPLFSLWSLRSIVIDWKNEKNQCIETSVVDQPMKMVSFLRLGSPSLSKSLLLNNVMSHQAHHTFWNRECPHGNSDHSLSDGLVETQWYLPSGKDADVFKEVTMFVNLRGDACDKEKEVSLITGISKVIVCCVETADLAKPDVLRVMKSIHDKAAKVVLLISTKDASTSSAQQIKEDVQQYFSHIGKDKMTSTKILSTLKESKNKTNDELKQDLRRILQTLLVGECGMSIVEAANIAKQIGAEVDESTSSCKAAKDNAEKVITCMKGKSANELKHDMLILQGEKWQKWCKLKKDEQRSVGKDPNADMVQELARYQTSMKQMRQDQLSLCKNMSPLMKIFLEQLLMEGNIDSVMIFMQWLKLHFDDLSRKTIPGLHQRYHKKWLEFTSLKTKGQQDKLGTLKKELLESEKNLAEASLGAEHILREVAQVYEASIESKMEFKQSWTDIINKLPNVAANLLLQGHPIEIMDGDAGCVPLTWVTAVFTNLAKLVGEKKLFVISVLGVQSSGKSTLLNTMFGLQFAVSAGRCTRGVYMQLLPVDKDRSNLPYDYALVIDTEGLRAPELGQLKYDNDNQLATFVIGLGDVTILNIKGENMAEVSDVLQIAVHAFLRMKLTKNTNRTCVFVHQNVPAINAKQKMNYGCQKLQDTLDEMTVEACRIENIVDIHTFNEVIEFDSQNNIWYFSDLWKGDPPMAPVNPGYTEKASEVKEFLVDTLARKQQTFLTFSDMKLRIEDLWRGVLTENFVFSFRNSLAARAYNSLERTYHEKSWTVNNGITEYLIQEAFSQLEKCTTVEELDRCCSRITNELEATASELKEKAQTDLKEFFDKHEQKDILIEWRTEKLNSLSNETAQFISKAQRDINDKTQSLNIDLLTKTKEQEHTAEIMNRAKTLAQRMKGQKWSDNDLYKAFEKDWKTWITEFSARQPVGPAIHVDQSVTMVLWNRLRSESSSLKDELLKHSMSDDPKLQRLKGSLNMQDIPEELLSININAIRKALEKAANKVFNRTETCKTCRLGAFKTVDSILARVDDYLVNISKENTGFKDIYVYNVLNLIIDDIEQSNEETKEMYTITKGLMIKVIVHACRYAVVVFKGMQTRYEEAHNVRKKMVNYKQTTWNLFKNTVDERKTEIIAADLLVDQLEIFVQNAVQKALPGKVTDHIVKEFGYQKFNLLTQILKDLADQSFGDFRSYISDPKSYALKWMRRYVDKTIFLDDNGMSPYTKIVESRLHVIMKNIKSSIDTAESAKPQNSMATWSTEFCKQLKELPMGVGDLKAVMEQNIKEFGYFTDLVRGGLDELEKKIVEHFRADHSGSVSWEGESPYESVMVKLWGCEAQCPFCNEICQKTSANHLSSNDSHMCIQHRPSAVRGTRWNSNIIVNFFSEKAGTLALETCNYDVQSDFTHGCGTCKEECRKQGKCGGGTTHSYKNYKSYLPHWDIAPSTSTDSSTYWRWFVAKYKNELATHYSAKVPLVPGTWHDIKKQEALDSLRIYET